MFAAPMLLRALNAREQIQTRRGVVHVPARDTVVEYVQAHVAAGEKILVYPYLPLYYYLTDTASPDALRIFPARHAYSATGRGNARGDNGRARAGGPVRELRSGKRFRLRGREHR